MILDYNKFKNRLNEFDILFSKKSVNTVAFENNKLKTVDFNQTAGFGLRIIKDNKIGFASSSDLSAVDTVINFAVDTAQYGEKAYFKISDSDFQTPDLKIFSKEVDELNSKNLLETGSLLLGALKKKLRDVFVNVEVEKIISEKEFFNSNDIKFKSKKSIYSISASLFRAEDNNFLELYDYISKTNMINQTEINKIVENLLFLYDNSQKSVSIETGYYPIYFTPKAFKYLISFLSESLNGKLIEKKISLFTDKIGENFFKKNFSIIDNPYLEGGLNSMSFDGDGLRPQKLFLIDKGKINSYVVDMQTAGKLGVSSNGHSMRGYSTLPQPNFTNVIFEFDVRENEDKIIKSIDKGIIVDQLLGAGQSNILGGEFSSNIDMGFYVENGEIKGRVKDCMISGNLFDFFNNIEKVTDRRTTYQNITTPGVLVSNISLAAK